jgi:hypothetical protein
VPILFQRQNFMGIMRNRRTPRAALPTDDLNAPPSGKPAKIRHDEMEGIRDA